MANSKQAKARRMKMAERASQLKDLHFPDVHEDFLWHRSKNDGFTTLPRTMPLIMEVADTLGGKHPAGQTLLTLWCRSPDHALVSIDNPAVYAAETGFTGQRAVDTWRRRMRLLVEQGFIRTKPGASGEFHYTLLINPYWVIEYRQQTVKDIPASIYNRFLERAAEIGAYGDIEEIRGHIVRWNAEAAAAAQAMAAAEAPVAAEVTAAAGTIGTPVSASPPPPPPPPPPPLPLPTPADSPAES